MRYSRFIKGIAILLVLLMLPAVAALAESEGGEAPAELIDETVTEAFDPSAAEEEPEEAAPPAEPEYPAETEQAGATDAPEHTAKPAPTDETPQSEGPQSGDDPAGNEEPPLSEDPADDPTNDPTEDPTEEEDIWEEGPERDITEEELEELEEATYDFTFQVDTIWESYGDYMFIAVRNAATMISAVNTITSLGEGAYIIALAADIELPASDVTLLRFTCGDTTILGCGHDLRFHPTDGAEPFITVEGTDTVVSLGSGLLEDRLTVSGGKPEENEDFPSLIAVRGGTLNIFGGTVLEGHEAGHGIGGAVCVEDGLARMYGGMIRNCGIVGYGDVYGGGIGVAWGGSFCMFDGEIVDCYAMSIGGTSYGGGIAAVSHEREDEPVYSKAPIQLQGGRLSGCLAANGGGAAFRAFPGVALIGGAEIQGNIAYGTDAGSGAGLWCDETDGFTLYIFDRCVIAENNYYSSAAYTTGLEAVETDGDEPTTDEPVGPVRGDAAFRLTDDARLLACTSDTCADEDVIRVGVLAPGALVSLADGSEILVVTQEEPEADLTQAVEALRTVRADDLHDIF